MRDVLHAEYSNPFVWGWITAEDILHVIFQYKSINWHNVRMSTYKNMPLRDGVCFTLTIDGKFAVTYSHYQYNSNFHELYKDVKSNMVLHDHIWEYVRKKYCERVARMLRNNNLPKFILLDDFTEKQYSVEQIEEIINKSQYPVLIFTDKNIISTNHLVKLIRITPDDMLPEIIVSNYTEDIKHFLYLNS